MYSQFFFLVSCHFRKSNPAWLFLFLFFLFVSQLFVYHFFPVVRNLLFSKNDTIKTGINRELHRLFIYRRPSLNHLGTAGFFFFQCHSPFFEKAILFFPHFVPFPFFISFYFILFYFILFFFSFFLRSNLLVSQANGYETNQCNPLEWKAQQVHKECCRTRNEQNITRVGRRTPSNKKNVVRSASFCVKKRNFSFFRAKRKTPFQS